MLVAQKEIMIKVILFLLLLVSVANANDRQTPHEMAEHYQREIREREDRNREKFDELERRANERELLNELREQKRQYEIDRIIDESNN